MLILGIETSCDDTCAAIVKASGGKKTPRFRILSNIRSSQIAIHRKFGGVVPHLAARAHTKNMNHVLKRCFEEADIPITDAKLAIDLITVTSHPGLIPCLLIGTHVARTLAWLWQKPIIGVNHLEGHIYANWINPVRVNSKIEFPAICLVVSGGHTQLVLMKGHGEFKIIGETRDDAAGEAFDKVAKLLGLQFPGGPPIAAKAAKIRNSKLETRNIKLPRPMMDSQDYDFSFSGLKTAVLYLVKERFTKNKRLAISNSQLANLCAEFQQAVIDVLIAKTIRAAKRFQTRTILLGGGVAANNELRKQLENAVKERLPESNFWVPLPSLSVDNAAMIAAAGYFRYLEGKIQTWKNVKARAVV